MDYVLEDIPNTEVNQDNQLQLFSNFLSTDIGHCQLIAAIEKDIVDTRDYFSIK